MNDQAILLAIEVLKQADFRRIQELGWHFQPADYYSACNDCAFLDANRDLWEEHEPLDIDWNIEGQLGVAREVSQFVEELRDVPQQSDTPGVYCWKNPMWNNTDALVQYGLVRSRQPRRYVEVGCGYSSLLLRDALARNERPCDVTLIEPYPNPDIFPHLPPDWQQHKAILQRVPLDFFDTLNEGDFLFYDGSHVTRPASDVNWFFFRVLPLIKNGVTIHIHDIMLPMEYPEDWIFNRGQTWNEQYVLQALLMHNRRYEVLIGNRYLWRKHPDELDRLYKGVQPSYGCSFWMRKRPE